MSDLNELRDQLTDAQIDYRLAIAREEAAELEIELARDAALEASRRIGAIKKQMHDTVWALNG